MLGMKQSCSSYHLFKAYSKLLQPCKQSIFIRRQYTSILKGLKPYKPAVNRTPNLLTSRHVFNKPPKDGTIRVRDIVKRIWSHIPKKDRRPIKVFVALSVALMFFSKACNISVPILYKKLVNTLNGEDETPDLKDPKIFIIGFATLFVLGYFAARVSSSFSQELRNALASRADQLAIRSETLSAFKHVHRMDMAFHKSKRMGSLKDKIEKGTSGVGQMLRSAMLNIIPSGLEFLAVTGIMLWYSGPQYALVITTSFVSYLLWTIIFTKRRNYFLNIRNKAERSSKNFSYDSFVNYETVKYFNNETFEAEKYEEKVRALEKARVKMTNSLAILNGGQNFILSSGLAVIMYLAAGDIQKGIMTVGDLVMLNAWMFQLSVPLNFLGSSYRDYVNARTETLQLYSLLQSSSEIMHLPSAPKLLLPENKANIVFDDVTFHYEHDKPILQGMSFEIPAGKKIAIVGGSGSGKSTIIRLLYRFYDPVMGRLLINGQDISKVDVESLRKAIGVVPQHCGLFHDTVRYNIQYGNLNSTLEQVKEAAKMAEIDQVIRKFPQGYDHQVGGDGDKLSGGEKQRVAIARVILKNSPIFVYDEATSSLDSVTEDHIMQSLQRVTQNRTTLVIAHRLSTVVVADEIIVLAEGKVAERGSHLRLLQDSDSLYAHLWNKQHEKALNVSLESDEAPERTATLDDVLKKKREKELNSKETILDG